MATSKVFTPTNDNQVFALKITGQLDQLSIARDKWEQNEYKKATDSKYELLSQTYAVYEQLFINATSDSDRRTLRMSLEERLRKDGVKTQKTSSTMGLLIRYVFKSDRKRVMRYRYAIEAAKSHGIASEGMSQWLRDNGGIDGVAKLNTPSEESLQKKEKIKSSITDVSQLLEFRKSNPLATIRIDSHAAQCPSILMAHPNADGSFNIICVVENVKEGLYKGLVRAAASQAVEVNSTNQQLQKEAKMFSDSVNVSRTDVKEVEQLAA
jgi:hypothetical protein